MKRANVAVVNYEVKKAAKEVTAIIAAEKRKKKRMKRPGNNTPVFLLPKLISIFKQNEKYTKKLWTITKLMFIIKVMKERGRKLKDYLLKLPQDLHAKIKVAAAIKGVSMMTFMIEAIIEKLEKEVQ